MINYNQDQYYKSQSHKLCYDKLTGDSIYYSLIPSLPPVHFTTSNINKAEKTIFNADTDLCRSQRETPDRNRAEQILKDTSARAPHVRSTPRKLQQPEQQQLKALKVHVNQLRRQRIPEQLATLVLILHAC